MRTTRLIPVEWDNVTGWNPARPFILRRLLRSAGPAKNLIRAILPLNTRASLSQRFSKLLLNPKPELRPGYERNLYPNSNRTSWSFKKLSTEISRPGCAVERTRAIPSLGPQPPNSRTSPKP